MIYRDQIRPWAIFECKPDCENKCVARLRTQTDADAYASILRRGGGKFQVAFDQVEEVEEVTQG